MSHFVVENMPDVIHSEGDNDRMVVICAEIGDDGAEAEGLAPIHFQRISMSPRTWRSLLRLLDQ